MAKGMISPLLILTKVQRMDTQGIASRDVTNSGNKYALVRTLDANCG